MSRRLQLFVGRLPLDSKERDIEKIFERYGSMIRCNLKFGTGMAYAFVDYEDKRDAEDAIKCENGRKLHGQTIVVEWARGPSSRMARRGSAECYRCHRTGHWARDCPELDRYSSRRYSRSRSGDRKYRSSRRSGSKSPGYYYRGRRRWRTPSQTRSPSYNRSRKPPKKHSSSQPSSHSRSRSPSKDKKRDRKRSPSKSVSRSPRRSVSRSPSPKRHSRSITPKGKDRSRSRSKASDERKSAARSRSVSHDSARSKDDVPNGERKKKSLSRSRSPSPRSRSRSRSYSNERSKNARHDSESD